MRLSKKRMNKIIKRRHWDVMKLLVFLNRHTISWGAIRRGHHTKPVEFELRLELPHPEVLAGKHDIHTQTHGGEIVADPGNIVGYYGEEFARKLSGGGNHVAHS